MPGPRGRAPTSSATLQSLKPTFGSSVCDDLVQRRERAVIELHDDALQRAECRRDFEQVQVDRLVRAEHLARGDPEGERVADLARGAGDGDVDGSLHEGFSLV